MERRKPMKRTPMKRSGRVRARSENTAEVYREERIPLVEDLLRRFPKCQLRVTCNGDPSVDVHELMRRSRLGSITDPKNCLTACRECHTWVTEHDGEAQCLGLSLPSWAENIEDDPWAVAERLRERTGEPCPWRDVTRGCPAVDDRQCRRCEPLPDA